MAKLPAVPPDAEALEQVDLLEEVVVPTGPAPVLVADEAEQPPEPVVLSENESDLLEDETLQVLPMTT